MKKSFLAGVENDSLVWNFAGVKYEIEDISCLCDTLLEAVKSDLKNE